MRTWRVRVLVVVAALILLAGFGAVGYYVWPTPWVYYSHWYAANDDADYITFRRHRVTGRVEMRGWQKDQSWREIEGD